MGAVDALRPAGQCRVVGEAQTRQHIDEMREAMTNVSRSTSSSIEENVDNFVDSLVSFTEMSARNPLATAVYASLALDQSKMKALPLWKTCAMDPTA